MHILGLVPATQVTDADWVLGSWLGPELAVVGFWGSELMAGKFLLMFSCLTVVK